MTGPEGRPPLRPRGRGEQGETLVEALMTVVLLGLAFTVVLGGVGTALVSSATQRRVTGADSLVRSAAERIVAEPYARCASGYPTPAPPAGFTVTVEVRYWDGADGFGPVCPAADTGVQKVTLTVRSTGPRPVRDTTLEVIKREAVPA